MAFFRAVWDHLSEPGPSFLGFYTTGGVPEQKGFWNFYRIRRQEEQEEAQARKQLASARAYDRLLIKENATQRRLEDQRVLENLKRQAEEKQRMLELEQLQPPPPTRMDRLRWIEEDYQEDLYIAEMMTDQLTYQAAVNQAENKKRRRIARLIG